MPFFSSAAQEFTTILASIDIQVGGSRPWDIRVSDERVFAQVLREGSLGLGEAYMDGWWDCDALDQFFSRIFLADLDSRAWKHPKLVVHALFSRLFNYQSRRRA